VITEAIHYQGADGSTRTAVRLAISDNGPVSRRKSWRARLNRMSPRRRAAPAWACRW
jgi:hypothetical protein